MIDVQALEGCKVLDVSTFLAGPFCATQLGEFGADVIKIELPGGGRRHAPFRHHDGVRRLAAVAVGVAQQALHHAGSAQAGRRRVAEATGRASRT